MWGTTIMEVNYHQSLISWPRLWVWYMRVWPLRRYMVFGINLIGKLTELICNLLRILHHFDGTLIGRMWTTLKTETNIGLLLVQFDESVEWSWSPAQREGWPLTSWRSDEVCVDWCTLLAFLWIAMKLTKSVLSLTNLITLLECRFWTWFLWLWTPKILESQ